jgi:superfamily II DNA/RNA helicase
LLKDPVRIQLAANQDRHAAIQQRLHHADDHSHKHELLSHYLSSTELSQAVIFTATKRGADRLAKRLANQGHTSAALHGDMGQGARKRTVEQMRRGKFRLLVATDVAARGLDIKGISHVINYDLPIVAEDYIHRIGRTGRGGATGTAVSLVGPEDWSKLHGIERLTGRKLEREVIAGLEPSTPEPKGAKPSGNGRKRKRFSKGKSWAGKPGRKNGAGSNGSAAKGRRQRRAA